MADPARRYDSSPVTPSVRATRPRRALFPVALVAVIALVFSGCEAGTAWIARVDKKPIDAPNFWSGVPLYASIAGQQLPTDSADTGTYPVADAAAYALFLVQKHAMEQMNAENGTPVTPVAISLARDELVGGPGGATFADLPGWFLDQLAEFQANSTALVDHLGAGVDNEAAVEEFYEANREQFTKVCLDVISDEDERELVQARQRLEEGADFVDVARAVASAQGEGLDGSPIVAYGENEDGDIGCVETSTLANLFMDPSQTAMLTDAGRDALVGPVPIAGGAFMLFRVRSVETQSLDEVRPVIEQQVGAPGAREAGEALNEYLMTRDIELNPRLGEWTSGIGYRPPEGAEQPPGDLELTPEMLEMLG